MQGAQEVIKDPRGTSLLSRHAAPSKRAPGPGSGSTSETGPGINYSLRDRPSGHAKVTGPAHKCPPPTPVSLLPPPAVPHGLATHSAPSALPVLPWWPLRTSTLTGLGPRQASSSGGLLCLVSAAEVSPPHNPCWPRRVPGSSLASPAAAACCPLWDGHRSPLLGRAGFAAHGVASGQWSVLMQGSRDGSPSGSPWTNSLQAVGLGVWGAKPSVQRFSSLGTLAEHRAPICLLCRRVRAPDSGPQGTSPVRLGFCGFAAASGRRGSY